MTDNPQIADESASEPLPKAKCAGIKRNGEPCGAWRVGGTELCAGHSRLGIGVDPKAYNLQAAEVRREKAAVRKLGVLDAYREVLDAKASEIAARMYAAGADDWRALEAMVTRVHGKPVERVETTETTDPLGIQAMSREERNAMLARLLDANPELRSLVEPTRTPNVHPLKKSA